MPFHPLILISSCATVLICTHFFPYRRDETRAEFVMQKFQDWQMWWSYVISKGCYIAALTITLVISSFVDVLAWEMCFILPMLFICFYVIEHLALQNDLPKLHYVLHVETGLLFVLLVTSMMRFLWAWPLHVLNIVSLYYNIVSERSFYASLVTVSDTTELRPIAPTESVVDIVSVNLYRPKSIAEKS
jgi:hypothetical protein